AEQLLTWIDGRNASAFRNLAWTSNTLTFSVDIGTGARNLRVLLPTRPGDSALSLVSLTSGGAPVAFTRETIKGVEYAAFLASAAAYTAVYDPGPPETDITLKPAAISASAAATFGFTASQAAATFTCSLDGAPFTACASPIAYASLANGAHTFAVQAATATGADATPASYGWTIDTTAPVLGIVALVPTDNSSVITWTTDEASDSAVDFGTAAGSLGTHLADGTMTLN